MEESSSSSPARAHRISNPPGGQVLSSELHQYSDPSSKETDVLSSSPQNMSHFYPHASQEYMPDDDPGLRSTSAFDSNIFQHFESAPVCMYRGDCQTGSQLRKAISHIFGRNKLCTRMIPTGVWVHYCRKHYQRTRYRNGGEYPQRQIGLVQVQIRRVQAWSDSNIRQNRGPVLKDWSLSVRKREQLRLHSKTTTGGKKRPFQDEKMECDESYFDDDQAELSGTAVPDWIVAQIGDGFSTSEVLAIVDRLKSDIDESRLQQIPDIEILPNIVTDSNNSEPAINSLTKKAYTKRRSTLTPGVVAADVHRRSQSASTSTSTTLRYDSSPIHRRSSQPKSLPNRTFAEDYSQLPVEKRQRVENGGISTGQHYHHQHYQHYHCPGDTLDLYDTHVAHLSGFSGASKHSRRPCSSKSRETHVLETNGCDYPEGCGHSCGPETGSSASDIFGHQSSLYGNSVERHYGNIVSTVPDVPAYGFDVYREHERHHSTCSVGQNEVAYGVLPSPNIQRLCGMPVAQRSDSTQQMELPSYIFGPVASRRAGVHQRLVPGADMACRVTPAPALCARSAYAVGDALLKKSNLPLMPMNFAEKGSFTEAYPAPRQYQTHSNSDTFLMAHHAHHVYHGPSHGQNYNMNHGQDTYGINFYSHSCDQVNQSNTPNQCAEAESQGSLRSQSQNIFCYEPSLNGGTSMEAFGKFENIQLPPLQCIAHTTASPLQSTSPPIISALNGSAQPTHLSPIDRSIDSGHLRHDSKSSVAYMLGPHVEQGS
ncbi:hypothetical protein SEPCBS57363_004828 [Sporothrix epigloea]|uniref:Orp1 like protein n=1 Tax=Sporothrix epigloea TaxID=1892477 RepID=A0ABP0DY31_9PEZI